MESSLRESTAYVVRREMEATMAVTPVESIS